MQDPKKNPSRRKPKVAPRLRARPVTAIVQPARKTTKEIFLDRVDADLGISGWILDVRGEARAARPTPTEQWRPMS